ncbi:MAG: hypothetical protein FJX39_03520 [Alphaproteobacteria bacterium]|nr:hypothetical protein [Alphaproteobacteria bacterium]
MKTKLLVFLALLVGAPLTAHAQQRSYSGVTAEDIAEEQEACGPDAYKFCGGNDIALFEMESCLSRHVNQLSRACRLQIAPTNFKEYYNEEPHLFGE